MAGEQSAATGDIQSPQAPVGSEYGTATDQLKGQAIIPVAGKPAAPSHSSAVANAGGGMPPGSGVPLDAESMYPGEPIQAGLSLGPGPGPEALNFGQVEAPELSELRTAYQMAPSEALRRLIEWSEANQ